MGSFTWEVNTIFFVLIIYSLATSCYVFFPYGCPHRLLHFNFLYQTHYDTLRYWQHQRSLRPQGKVSLLHATLVLNYYQDWGSIRLHKIRFWIWTKLDHRSSIYFILTKVLILLYLLVSIKYSLIRLKFIQPLLGCIVWSGASAFAGGSLPHKTKPNMPPRTLMNSGLDSFQHTLIFIYFELFDSSHIHYRRFCNIGWFVHVCFSQIGFFFGRDDPWYKISYEF